MKRNIVERIVLGASVAAIALLVAVLVLEAVGEARPADPQVEVHLAEARLGSLGWIVPATVANGGDEAAEAVVLEASASVGGQNETRRLELDFLPARTEVDIAFAFSAPPDGAVVVRLIGFRLP